MDRMGQRWSALRSGFPLSAHAKGTRNYKHHHQQTVRQVRDPGAGCATSHRCLDSASIRHASSPRRSPSQYSFLLLHLVPSCTHHSLDHQAHGLFLLLLGCVCLGQQAPASFSIGWQGPASSSSLSASSSSPLSPRAASCHPPSFFTNKPTGCSFFSLSTYLSTLVPME